MSFLKYLIANRLWILLVFYAVSGFFIWYWWRFQDNYEMDIKIVAGLNLFITLLFLGGNFYKMEAIAALICVAPTIWEVVNDRNGETKKDKIRDGIITAIFYAVITLALWWVHETHPLKSLALMLGVRVMVFDYAIQYILIKRGVIHGYWFTYSGKTSWFDRRVSKVNPWLRLTVRVILFAGTAWWFLR